KASDGSFEALVQILRAADKAHRGQTVAVMVEAVVGGGDEGRVVGQAKVVVGAEVDDLVAADLDGRSLGALQLALALVQAALAKVLQLRLQDLTQVLVAHGPLSVVR